MSNDDISDAFSLLSKLMDLHGENAFKAKSYATAAFNIEKIPQELSAMTAEEMAAIISIGVTIRQKIQELLTTGHMKVLDDLLAKTPEGVLQLMKVKGLGPKKVSAIWHELNIESIGELKYACLENRLTLLKGIGEKVQQNVLQQIQFIENNTGYFRYADIEHMSETILKTLTKELGENAVSETGALRRCDTTLNQLEYVVQAEAAQIQKIFPDAGFKETTNHTLTSLTESSPAVVIHLTNAISYCNTLFTTTANAKHLEPITARHLLENHNFYNEQDIYAGLNKPYIVPEMRNGTDEWEWADKYNYNDLITVADLKGQVHNHSTYSDGKNTIEEMARACMAQGMEYFVICDHSQVAIYANGLTPERIVKQHKEIDALNARLAPFKIFKGTECDILNDGQMDYDNGVLKTLDVVVASIHTNFKMDIDKATARLIKAIENPYTRILGHPTGRLLLSREGYPVDHDKIIDACAANGVAIEINANPYRLDIDWTWIYTAMEKGVWLSINPDAHNTEGLKDIHYGVLAARKGGLIKSRTLNALPLAQFEHWVKEGKQVLAV